MSKESGRNNHSLAWVVIGSCIIIVVLLAVSRLPCRAGTADAFLDVPLGQFNAPAGIVGLWDLCRTLNRPCGEEKVRSQELSGGKMWPSLKQTKTSPRRVLDALIDRSPGYQWVIRNDVINLEPKKREGEDILSKRLDTVSINGVTSFKAALDVFQQAGIRVEYQTQGRVRLGIIDLTLKNVTIREALNAIVKADGEAMWFITSGKTAPKFMILSWRKSGATSIHERRKPKEPGQK